MRRWSGRALRDAAVVALAAVLAGGATAPPPAPSRLKPVARGVGAVALPPLFARDGSRLSLAALRGRTVVVNFWASWCVPCRAELPSLERLAAKRKDLIIVAISVDARREDGVAAFAGHYPHLSLGFGALSELRGYGALGVPYSVVLDRQGRETARVPRSIAWDGAEGARFLPRG